MLAEKCWAKLNLVTFPRQPYVFHQLILTCLKIRTILGYGKFIIFKFKYLFKI